MDENERKEKAKLIVQAIKAISHYPAFATYKNKEKAKNLIIKIYKKGDNILKGLILSYINEKLALIRHIKEFDSIGTRREKNKQANFGDVSTSIFDYAHSLEGTMEFLEILSKLDDKLSIKLLTYHLTRYLNINSPLFNALTNYIISLLASSRNIYAAEVLLRLYDGGIDERSSIFWNLIYALTKWKDKINYIKASKLEKSRIKRKLNEVLSIELEELRYIR